jgi:acyl carrier protein
MTQNTLQNWLREKISAETGAPAAEIDTHVPFENFNMDSLSMITLSYELEQFTGREIDPTIFYEYDTIDKLVTKLQNSN